MGRVVKKSETGRKREEEGGCRLGDVMRCILWVNHVLCVCQKNLAYIVNCCIDSHVDTNGWLHVEKSVLLSFHTDSSLRSLSVTHMKLPFMYDCFIAWNQSRFVYYWAVKVKHSCISFPQFPFNKKKFCRSTWSKVLPPFWLDILFWRLWYVLIWSRHKAIEPPPMNLSLYYISYNIEKITEIWLNYTFLTFEVQCKKPRPSKSSRWQNTFFFADPIFLFMRTC